VRDGEVVARAVSAKQLAIHALPAGGTQEQAIEPERQEQATAQPGQVPGSAPTEVPTTASIGETAIGTGPARADHAAMEPSPSPAPAAQSASAVASKIGHLLSPLANALIQEIPATRTTTMGSVAARAKMVPVAIVPA
jgi:hypothetical protein